VRLINSAALIESLFADERGRMNVFDQFLDQLLSRFLGWPPRSTDGTVFLFEDRAEGRYFGVARVYLIDGGDEPACFDLSYVRGVGLTDGRIVFGVKDGRLPDRVKDRKKLYDRLTASPLDAVRSFEWTLGLRYAAGGWIKDD
jgi:hypothetical protein